MHEKERKNLVLHADALTLNYRKLLKKYFQSNVIDYLQLDIEPSKNTFEALLSIPFDEYEFRVITYEHDDYVDMSGVYREKSRNYLKAMGYKLLVNDIAPNEGSNFEDWWIKEDLVNPEILLEFLKIEKKMLI